MFSMRCKKKNTTVEDNKKRMNIANFIVYMEIYIPILYVTRMDQNKIDLINSYSSMVMLTIIVA